MKILNNQSSVENEMNPNTQECPVFNTFLTISYNLLAKTTL